MGIFLLSICFDKDGFFGQAFFQQAGMSEHIVPRLKEWKNSAIFRKIYEHVGQTINEKGIAVDALSRYEF